MNKYCVFLGTEKQCELVFTLLKEKSYMAKDAKDIVIKKNGIANFAILTEGISDFTNKLVIDEIPVLILKHFEVE